MNRRNVLKSIVGAVCAPALPVALSPTTNGDWKDYVISYDLAFKHGGDVCALYGMDRDGKITIKYINRPQNNSIRA